MLYSRTDMATAGVKLKSPRRFLTECRKKATEPE